MRVGALVFLALVAVAAGSRQAAPATPPPPPRVTVIGDSVAAELDYDTPARDLLARGVRLDLEAAACRRIEEPSCTVAGIQPPTLDELVRARGRSLGPVVVVAVGYNDSDWRFRETVRSALAALDAASVRRVLWLTYRASQHPYLHMNDDLRALARHDPSLTLLDWNRYSRSHPSWFERDGVHLSPAGAGALARFLHGQLVKLGIAA